MDIETDWEPFWIASALSKTGKLVAEIGAARNHETMREVWFCPLRMPQIFETDMKIAGVDAEKAFDLSVEFIRTFFEKNSAIMETFQVRAADTSDDAGI